MPLTKELLPLDPAPGAVAAARRWVGQACTALGRGDLVECAELGVSELVTNAILHGTPPLFVRIGGTVRHPRIEVHDGSRRAPVLPTTVPGPEDVVDEDLLTTFGRGLSLVAMAADAWGATVENEGKIVWFAPSAAIHQELTEGVIEGSNDLDAQWEPLPDSLPITLLGMDVVLLVSMLNQYSNLRRELRLLALSHDVAYPLARDLTQMFATFERQFPPSMLLNLARHLGDDHGTTDLTFEASPHSIQVFTTVLDMLEVADQFCESQHLLSLSRTSEQRRLQEWLYAEFVHQCHGGEPRRWTRSLHPSARAV